MLKYWYFLLPAILCAIVPSETIDRATRKWIPDNKKRAKFFLLVLTGMCLFYSVALLLVTKNLPWGVRIPLALFPLLALGLGLLMGKFLHRK